ncbi:hypothetical protein N9089_05075, partial [Crocinitomicaceae bacterium]|nr:hypothetical protein [Crocinitomicaceae bacterium]
YLTADAAYFMLAVVDDPEDHWLAIRRFSATGAYGDEYLDDVRHPVNSLLPADQSITARTAKPRHVPVLTVRLATTCERYAQMERLPNAHLTDKQEIARSRPT